MDASVIQQTYVEDCEVCCNPIEVMARFENDQLMAFEANELGQ